LNGQLRKGAQANERLFEMSCRKFKDLIKSFFVYDTAAYVRINDKRLASLYFLAMGGIFAYVVCWTIVWNQTYLLLETPTGSVRINPMKPSKWSEIADLPYCKRENHNKYNGFPTYECVYWDEALNVFPLALDNTITLSSRMTVSHQSVTNCSLTDPHCEWQDTEPETINFLADVERFTLLIDHAYYAPTVKIQGSARDLKGRLLDSKGKEMTVSKPDVVGVPGEYDILQVGTILKAGNIDLDTASFTNKNISLRYDGCVIFVYIEYSNTFTWNLYKMRYTIRAEAMSGTKFKAVQPVYTKHVEDRVIYDRHGIHIIFLQTGRLGKFDFQTLLLSFVSGIGLITFSTVIVDFIATKLIKERDTVNNLKYRETGSIQNREEKDLMAPGDGEHEGNGQYRPPGENTSSAESAAEHGPAAATSAEAATITTAVPLEQPLLQQV